MGFGQGFAWVKMGLGKGLHGVCMRIGKGGLTSEHVLRFAGRLSARGGPQVRFASDAVHGAWHGA
jgi:hypothetical protein